MVVLIAAPRDVTDQDLAWLNDQAAPAGIQLVRDRPGVDVSWVTTEDLGPSRLLLYMMGSVVLAAVAVAVVLVTAMA